GEFLLEPFFTRPADAIGSSVAIIIAAATVSVSDAEVPSHAAHVGRVVVIACAGALTATAIIAVVFKDAAGRTGTVAEAATSVVGRLGRARWLFSALLFAAGYAAFAHSSGRVAALYLTWFAVIVLAPLESVFTLAARRRPSAPAGHGTVQYLDDPSMLVARLPRGTEARLGDEVELETGAAGSIVEVTSLSDEPTVRVALATAEPVKVGTHITLTGMRAESPTIGHITDGTSIEEAVIATVPLAAEVGLEEGNLVEAAIRGTPTLYQIVGAELYARTEDDLHRHLVRVRARKLGQWNAARTVFEPVAWVPYPGEPVRLLSSDAAYEFDERFVGHVPGTTYGVAIDPHLAVTHNTAILGILGIGKTHLAWELIRRMLADGIKVVALDITGSYADHFSDVCPADTEAAIAAAIERRISGNVAERHVRDDEAGNIDDFRRAVGELLHEFVESEQRLLILNPNRFEVTRMEGRPFSGAANMLARVTMVEITRIIAEKLLELLQSRQRDPRDESAALCLALEEAHSLVPEWNSATNEAERQAVNGTARAVLQGRKYGYGSLLITQRTANVTKSILNQCNTIFGMRVYDATGMGFLENYIGPTYAQLLASLHDRQAVIFGRASSCNSPLSVDLNESTAFLDGFWAARRGDVPVTQSPTDQELVDEEHEPLREPEDDIPF